MSNGVGISTWAHRCLLMVLLAGGAAAVCYRITAPTMWADEVCARTSGLGPFRGLLRSPDPHVVSAHVYHLLNRVCEAITGDIHLGNRLPQAVAAWCSLVFVYLLARRCFSPGAGLVAVVLLVTQPWFVRYAQENRPQQMISCLMLVALYCTLTYAETRHLAALIGFIVSSAVLLRCGYGVLPFVVFLLLWPFMYAVARPSGSRTAGHAVWEYYAGAAIVVASWLPHVLMGVRAARTHGVLYGLTRGVPALDWFWRSPMALTPQAVLAFCGRYAVEALDWRVGILLVTVALCGSLYYRRRAVWSALAFALIMTLASFYAMNIARGGIVPRRYIYLCPLTMFVIAGGVSMTVMLVTQACSAFLLRVTGKSHAYAQRVVAWCVRPVVWGVLFAGVCWPLVCDHAYQLSQYYFTDRHVYRTMAYVLDTCAAPNAEVISVDTDTRDWAIDQYASGRWYTPRIYLTQQWYNKPATFSPDVLARAFASSSEVWITHLDPGAYGYPPDRYVRVPCGESWRYGTLTCIKPAYPHDAALRAHDASTFARAVLASTSYPKVTCAQFLADMLLRRGDTNAADAVMRQIGNYRWSYAATRAAAAYFAARGDHAAAQTYDAGFARRTWWRRLPVPGIALIPTTWPDQFPWVDYTDFGLAADVAGIARPDEWLGPRVLNYSSCAK